MKPSSCPHLPMKVLSHDKGEHESKAKHHVQNSDELLLEKYDIGKKIGRGADGVVRICNLRQSWIANNYNFESQVQTDLDGKLDEDETELPIKQLVTKRAIKIIKKSKLDDSHINNIYTELDILHQLAELQGCNDHILQCFDTFETIDNFYIITELLSNDTMISCIHKVFSQNKRFDESSVCDMFSQLCDGLSYLHELNIVHRDLKPQNILFKRDNENKLILKIVDFGLAGVLTKENNFQLTQPCGTPFYVAPEMVDLTVEYYDSKVDMWSAGIILYAMFCGQLPFYLGDNDALDVLFKQILIKDIEKTMISHHWKFVSHSGKQLMLGLLERDRNERLSAKQTLKHPWFNKISPSIVATIDGAS